MKGAACFPIRSRQQSLRGACVGGPNHKCDLRAKPQEKRKPVQPNAAMPERPRGCPGTSASLRAKGFRLRDDVPVGPAARPGAG